VTDVVCIGLATRDTVWRVPSLPPPDGRVVADEVVVAGGGPAATAAVTLARLGVAVAFAGAVGDDEAGAFARDGLAAEGVDVSPLAVVRGARTPQSTVLVEPGGSRAIVHDPGTAKAEPAVPAARWAHVDHVGWSLVARLTPDTAVSVDGGNPIDGLDLSRVTLYAPTAAALHEQFGDAEAARAAGAAIVVVTEGAGGSYGVTRAGTVRAEAVACDAVSTLGAGDVFHGALLAWLLRDAPLDEALRAANAAAALSCRALDGRSAIPTRAELEAVVG
jgi:sugar/nucleoside kinase (ribokinase family)